MTREDVIGWLEYLSDDARSKANGYVPTNIEIACGMAIDALKAQEPVKPTTKNGAYFCGNPYCRKIIAQMVPCGTPTHRVKYCSECGRKVKWCD